ncbi:hypothetical protein TSAR_009058 [Trichomalopsis sarcophagae]|uniref:Uncharacterized protein n=1 Tax=Trichomalopsis sarcophagae TaxID=543379 RepID=A0A232EWI3_9HYME|nr:hypothetical protein TSAR_009058 [Trichomalopsis sarcophagae]
MSNSSDEAYKEKRKKIQDVLNVIKKARNVEYSRKDKVILILGNAGVGKSIFTESIASNDKTYRGTTSLHTSLPKFIEDTEHNVTFYDCPDFSDDLVQDITGSYFIKNIIESADSIKLVFLVDISLMKETEQVPGFISFIKRVITLIKNLEKFKLSTALVVTNVDKYYTTKSDLEIKQHIGKIGLDGWKYTFQGSILNAISNDQRKSAVRFIDNLKDEDGNYARLDIFRTVNNSDKFTNITLSESNKNSLKDLLHNKMNFRRHEQNDFGYAMPAGTNTFLNDLIETVNNNIVIDVKNVGEQIEKSLQNREKQSDDKNDLRDAFFTVHKVLSSAKADILNCTESQCLKEILVQTIDNLNMVDFDKDTSNIHNYGKFLEFIKSLNSESNTPGSLQWGEGLTDVIKYLDDSYKWYRCLTFLDVSLAYYNAQYAVQVDITSSRDVNELSQELSRSGDIKENIDRRLQLLKEITANNKWDANRYDEFNEKCVNDFKSIKLNEIKLKFLDLILDESIRNKMTFSCTGDKLEVRGQYILLQNVIADDYTKLKICPEAKVIEIFALKKIFLDKKFQRAGNETQFSILAPEWEIINGYIGLINGFNGETGTWTAGGNFIGISQRVKGMDNLRIDVADPMWQRVYDGNNLCVNRDMIYNLQSDENTPWFKNSCKIDIENEHFSEGTCLFHKDCTFPEHFEKTGDRVFIITEKQANFKTNSSQEEVRLSKNECRGQNGGIHENCVDVRFTRTLSIYWSRNSPEPIRGGYTYTFHPRSTVTAQLPIVINNYKSYVRKNLAHSSSNSPLRKFIYEIDNNDFYSTLDFVDELTNLEEDYFNFKEKTLFLPFYEKMLKRIDRYAYKLKNSGVLSGDNKEVLRYLYLAVLSKIRCIKDDVYNDYTRNLASYLNDSINKINQIRKDNYYKDYQDQIQGKIQEADDIVKDKLTTEIKPFITQIEENMQSLVSETVAKIDQAIADKKEHEKAKKTLKDLYILRWIIGITKVASVALAFLGPPGAIVAAAAQGAIGITESLVLDDLSPQGIDKPVTLSPTVVKSISKIQDLYKAEQTAYKEQLHKAEQTLKDLEVHYNDDANVKEINTIRDKVRETREKLEKEDRETKNYDKDSLDRRATIKQELVDLLKKEKEHLESKRKSANDASKAHIDIVTDRNIRILNHVQTAVSMAEMGVELYGKIANHRAKIDHVDALINADDLKIMGYKQFKKDIYENIMPISNNIKETVTNATKTLAGLSRVSLDVAEWQITNMLGEAKLQLANYTEDFANIRDSLTRCIGKLEKLMRLMISTHAKIQSYKESEEFAKFIADINLSKSEDISIEDNKLKDAVQKLKFLIHRNIVLHKYDNCLNAFKQRVFPLADHYLKDIYIPTYLQDTEMNSTVNGVVGTLEKLRDGLNNYLLLSENPFRFKQHKNGIFGCRRTPFFKWKHAGNKNDIQKLLEGKVVVLKSDVRRGVNENAIKFTQIGIRFRLANRVKQNHFDDLLQGSRIVMKHLGTSNYRCDDKFYTIKTNEIVLKYEFNNNCNESPIDPNAVYQDVVENGPALSPYAMWSVQIVLNDDVNFDEYRDEEIDLQLEGKAEYYELGSIDDPEKLCSENMGNYYEEDDTIADVKFVNLSRHEILREEIRSGRITHDTNTKNRQRRNVVFENGSIQGLDQRSVATNSAYSNVKSSFINTFFSFIGNGLMMLKYWKPENELSQWFVDYNDNVDTEKQHVVNEYHHMDMKLMLNDQFSHKGLPNESGDKSTSNVENVSDAALLCNNANLLLLDSLIRWKNGMKHKQRQGTLRNDFVDAGNDTAQSIIGTYFMKNIIEAANSIKLVFVVDFFVMQDPAQISSFITFVNHIIKLVKGLEKFKYSMALIVTHAEKYYKEPDSEMINHIGSRGLDGWLDYFQNIRQLMISDDQRKIASQFIENLKDDDTYKRVGIFRTANESGGFTNITLFESNRKSLKDLLHNKLYFSTRDENDFSYILPPDTDDIINNLIATISTNILTEIKNAGEKIHNFFLNREKQSGNIDDLREIFSAAHQVLSSAETAISKCAKTQCLKEKMIQIVDNLNIRDSREDIYDDFPTIDNYGKFLEFIISVSSVPNMLEFRQWGEGLMDVVKYLNDSYKWYSCLTYLDLSLGDYLVQFALNSYDATIIDEQGNTQKLDEFLQQLSRSGDIEESNISGRMNLLRKIVTTNPNRYDDFDKKCGYDFKSMKVNEIKLKFLGVILDEGIRNKSTSTCVDDKLKIRGQYVWLDSAIKGARADWPSCSKAKLIEIFALKKIFFNHRFEMRGDQVQLSIVAPEWKITLNGGYIGLASAYDSESRSWTAGGNFTGISQRVTRLDYLHIENIDPWYKTETGYKGNNLCVNESLIDKLFFDKNLAWFNSTCKIDIKNDYFSEGTCLFPKNCTFPEHFEKAGDSIILITENQSNFKTNSSQEEVRLSRNGCRGQNGQINENCVDVRFTRSMGVTWDSNTSEPIPGGYTYTFHPRSAIATQVPSVINNYKRYVRENLAYSLKESSLRKFLDELDINDFYNTLDFVNELRSLEEQYYNLKDKISFIPFYESMLNRIERYAYKLQSSGELNGDNKEVLRYLYLAVLSKIRCVKDDVYNDYSRNLASYLNDSINQINQIRKDDSYDNYQDQIQSKIEEAEDIIANKLIKGIDPIISKIEKNIQSLISETTAKIDQAIEDKKKHEAAKERLNHLYWFRWASGIIKIASAALAFLGPLGIVAAVAVQGVVGITEFLVYYHLTPEGINTPAVLSSTVIKSVDRIREAYRAQQTLFKKRLFEIEDDLRVSEREFQDSNGKELTTIREKIHESRKKLDEEDKNQNYDKASLDRRANIKKELSDLVKKENKILDNELKSNKNAENTRKDMRFEKKLRIVNHVQTVIDMAELGVDLYAKLSEDTTRINLVDNLIHVDDIKIIAYKQLKNDIFNTIIPLSQNVKQNVNSAIKSLAGLSKASLIAAEEEIKTMLEKAKLKFGDYTDDFKEINSNLTHCINDLENLMGRMISINRQIQSYKESQEFAKFIANINLSTSDGIRIADKDYKNALQELEFIIHRGIALRKYDNSINAFKQHVFPFADSYLKDIYIPKYLQYNDIDSTPHGVVRTLEKLREGLRDYVLGRNTNHFKKHKGGIFGCGSTAFFEWKYEKNKNDIKKLLEGKEVKLESEVRRGINKNAIKFYDVGIRFRLTNRAKQNHFDDLMHGSQIKMKHHGNSHYKCGDKYYTIATKEIVDIDYYFHKDCNATKIDPNAIYHDLADNGPSLSPYATWSVQINIANGVNFDAYKDEEMDLKLVGKAVYYELEKSEEKGKLCSDNMDKYYEVDDRIADVKLVNLSYREEILSHEITPRNTRSRRSVVLDEDSIQDLSQRSVATSGACSNAKSSFINTFFSFIGSGLMMLKYWKPENELPQWFVDYNDNVDIEKQHVVNEYHHMNMQLVFSQKGLPNESGDKSTPNVENVSDAALFCNNANLLLLDSLIRWKNGMKHKQRQGTLRNDFVDAGYAHNLAYRGYLYEDN